MATVLGVGLASKAFVSACTRSQTHNLPVLLDLLKDTSAGLLTYSNVHFYSSSRTLSRLILFLKAYLFTRRPNLVRCSASFDLFERFSLSLDTRCS